MNAFADFANRLAKNARHREKWAKRRNIEAYRLYDRDVPQFPFALDRYGAQFHLQEYDNGYVMPPETYAAWLEGCRAAVAEVFAVAPAAVHLKKRARQRGERQYEKSDSAGEDFTVQENGRKFWVNLEKYLDTGLFLDHRNTRARVGETAAGKRFLNLFAYTGSFSVYAATGDALSSETVDLSNTYLEWARRNFILNGIDETRHTLIRADVSAYLQAAVKARKCFDIIVMDPPSFSNSKKMDGVLDIQKDHVRLIQAAMQLLHTHGILYFSNNLRSFALDTAVEKQFAVTDISAQSVPEDFRNKKIHRCFTVCHKTAETV